MVATKIKQIFNLISLEAEKEKIKNSMIDLAFLFSKMKIFNKNKVIKKVFSSYVSDLFLWYFLDKKVSDLSFLHKKANIEKVEKFFSYENFDFFKDNNILEVFYLYESIIGFIYKDSLLFKNNEKIEKILNFKNKIDSYYLEFSTASNKDLSRFQREFLNENEKNSYLQIFKNNDLELEKFCYSFLEVFKYDKNNILDIRHILLKFLMDKNLGGLDETK